MSGRYFYLESSLNNLVLDLFNSGATPGNKVGMWKHHGGDNQLWYHDVIYNTIRTKANDDFVLDINDNNRLVVNEFNPQARNQRWSFHNNHIFNVKNGKVLDIAGGNRSEGAEVCQYTLHDTLHDGKHQIFTRHYFQPKEFLIISKMHGKVMDVHGSGRDPGTHVIMYGKNGGNNQVWYEAQDGTIRTKLNGFALSSDNGIFQIQPYDPRESRQWIKLGSKIVNRYDPKKVADIQGSNRDHSAKIIPYDYHGGKNQLWEYKWL